MGEDLLRAQLRDAVAHVREHVTDAPPVGLILGTGLGALASNIEVQHTLPFDDIPHMPVATVDSHAGRLVIGRLAGQQVAALQGRFHHYEGYSLQQVTFPVRLLHALGVRVLVLSGAAGGLNPMWQAGDLAMLSDHINLMGSNPLVGPNLDELGPRFPDMSMPYDAALQELTARTALELGIRLQRGVYAAVTGPNLETRAEYRMLRVLGADLVGMSTVPEVIVARHMDMRVLAVSVVTDLCLPDALETADIDTIISTATAAEPSLARLLTTVLQRLSRLDTGAAAGGDG
jgi:purine-nucleoside phosphorylase